ncbi:MAG: class I SAM-dependent methyltransferase [Bacteroidales bacterium]
MLFLTTTESKQWTDIKVRVISKNLKPQKSILQAIRPGLQPAFYYYIGTSLLTAGQTELGRTWISAGIQDEPGCLFSNAFLTSFLNRTNGRLIIPETIFEDARPFIHFAGVPVMKDSRNKFISQCGQSLPKFKNAIRIMDIGCGHGEMLVNFLKHLQEKGLVNDVEEILLIDPYPAMLNLAQKAVSEAFPHTRIITSQSRIENFSDKIHTHYDIALASLAYHHMPYEVKEFHLNRLKKHIDFFIIMELDANHDTPELQSPELVLSVYQAYGDLIDFIFSHDASIEVALASIDKFLMSEAISLLTEPRGKRNDYHMLRQQWHAVFQSGLGKEFQCYCDSLCFADENMGLFTMIYGKDERPGS